MGRYDEPMDADTVLAALPALEFVRQQFCRCAVAWLPSWYRSKALQFASQHKEHSAELGDAGLNAFRHDVGQLVAQAEAAVDFYLGDEVWWHYDQAMASDAIVYSVRLCMGRLALPLRRSGYLGTREWREFVVHERSVPTQETNESGGTIYRTETTRVPVPTGRFFYQRHWDEGAPHTDEWSAEMRDLFGEYRDLSGKTLREARERAERAKIGSQDQIEARIADVLNFELPEEPAAKEEPFRLPAPPSSEDR